jgi:glycosyltransferase involved in cell wall biosynthesis
MMTQEIAQSQSSDAQQIARALSVMFVVGRLNNESSGVTRIMCDLANALGRHGAPVRLYAADCPGMPSAPQLLVSPSRYISQPGMWLGGLSRSPKLRRQIDQDMSGVDVVHSHSLWMLPNHYACESALRHRKPMVFTAHGALEPWAMAHSRWKKRLVARWWQEQDLHNAACIHVNSKAEVAGIRTLGLKNPIAIVTNGVNLAAFDNAPSASSFSMAHTELAGKRVLLFLSRLHPKKGLGHLVEAWKPIVADYPQWHLVIAGPDDGAGTEVRSRIAALGISRNVMFTGALEGREKHVALAGAHAFVLPSFSEGFSMAILEAMAAGLPAVITTGCNFPEASSSGAAIEVEPNAAATEKGLRMLLEMSDVQRRAMGQRGRQLVEQRYTWDAVAMQMIELYAWLAGSGAQPAFVQR